LYRQIEALLIAELRAQTWRPGAMIPSEIALAARYGVSQGTVRKAIDALASQAVVVRRQGRGTFVASHDLHPDQFRFLRLRRDAGSEPLAPSSEILDCARKAAPTWVTQQLGHAQREPLLFIRRRLSVDAEPVLLEDIWLPPKRFEGLTTQRLRAYRGPLYGLFDSEFGVKMVKATERLKAVSAPMSVARGLGLPVSSPLLLAQRMSVGFEGEPVEVRQGYYRTHSLHYQLELN
jgi:GntR family transcriptional regulator